MNKDKQFKESRLIVRMTDVEHKTYKDYCDKNGYTMSKRVRLLIDKDIEGKLEFK
jgi:hypothetical protein